MRACALLSVLAAPALAQHHATLLPLMAEPGAVSFVHSRGAAPSAPNYFSYTSFKPGSKGCDPSEKLISGSVLVGSCQNISSPANGSVSMEYQCDGASSCTISVYKSADCSEAPASRVSVKTDGSCQSIKSPAIPGPPSYLLALQQSEGAKGLKKPVLAQYGDSKCSPPATFYVERGACNSFNKLSFKEVCVGGKPQSCTWTNSSTCPDSTSGGRCYPSPFSLTCKAVMQPDGTKRGIEELC